MEFSLAIGQNWPYWYRTAVFRQVIWSAICNGNLCVRLWNHSNRRLSLLYFTFLLSARPLYGALCKFTRILTSFNDKCNFFFFNIIRKSKIWVSNVVFDVRCMYIGHILYEATKSKSWFVIYKKLWTSSVTWRFLWEIQSTTFIEIIYNLILICCRM